MSRKGAAICTSASAATNHQRRPNCWSAPCRSAMGISTMAAMLRRAKTTTDGSSGCTAILMKKYGMPQKIEIAINKSQPLRVIDSPLYIVVHTLMLIQHPCQRKVALDVGAAGRAGERGQDIDQRRRACAVIWRDQKAGFTIFNDLIGSSAPKGNHRRARRHRLYRYQPKRFIPGNREEQTTRLTHGCP